MNSVIVHTYCILVSLCVHVLRIGSLSISVIEHHTKWATKVPPFKLSANNVLLLQQSDGELSDSNT